MSKDKLLNIPESEQDIIRSFYKETIYRFTKGKNLEEMREDVQFIIVGHMVPTLPFYIEALSTVGKVALVIGKSSNPDTKTKKWLEDKKIVDKIITGIDDLDKDFRIKMEESYRDKDKKVLLKDYISFNGIEFIKSHINISIKTIIIDIGGYFSKTLKNLSDDNNKDLNIIGYVEDTENGHQKYASEIDNARSNIRKSIEESFNIINDIKKDHEVKQALEVIINKKHNYCIPPIITVARSKIKDSEDYNVGKAITDAVDHILRVSDYTNLAESKTILIIGYGKIGSAAAKVASEKTKGSVLICEKDSVIRLKASAHSYKVVELEKGLKHADVIISCTGQRCLKAEHLDYLKNNVYIASCTSRDDEFDKGFLSQLVLNEENDSDNRHYYSNGKFINLLNDGNSVNFVEKAVHGYFIHGVLASLLVSSILIYIENEEKSLSSKPLVRGQLNDFNDLFIEDKGNKESIQSIIAETLMRHKLRSEPKVTNYKNSHNRYIPLDKEDEDLTDKILKYNTVYIEGKKKAGKSQIAEKFYIFNKSKYDIVWKFNKYTPLKKQFLSLAEAINRKFDKNFLISEIDTKANGIINKIKSFLNEHILDYLLVFENFSESRSAEYIPDRSNNKREHIIFTYDKTKNKQITDINPNSLIQLKGFPPIELFKFLINDDNYWQNNKENFKKLIWCFMNPEDYTIPLNISEGDLSVEKFQSEGDGQNDVVGMINLCTCFINQKRSEDKDFDIGKLYSVFEKSQENYDSIKLFLDYILNNTLDDKSITVLSLFYVLNLNSKISLSKDILNKTIKKYQYEEGAIEKLVSLNWIEEDFNNVYAAVYRGSYNKCISAILENILPKPVRNDILKFQKKLIENIFKTFITHHNEQLEVQTREIIDIISEETQSKENNITSKDEQSDHNTSVRHNPEDRKYIKNIVEKWKKGDKHIHAKASYHVAKYYESLGSDNLEESRKYAELALSQYKGKTRKEQKLNNYLKELRKSMPYSTPIKQNEKFYFDTPESTEKSNNDFQNNPKKRRLSITDQEFTR